MNRRKSMLRRLLTLAVLAGAGVACQDAAPPEMPPLEVVVMQVEPRDISIYLDMVGETHGSIDIPIRARVDGVLEEAHFLEGRPVKKGQLLYVIDPRPYESRVVEAEGRLAEARTRLAKAASDLERIRPLAEMDAVSQQDLDSATAQHEAAQGAMQAAEAQVEQAEIQLGYTRITAPVDGLIGISKAKIGEYVGSLTSALGFESRDLSELTDSGSDFWNAGAGLLAPLFNAGRNSSRVEAEQARTRAALLHLRTDRAARIPGSRRCARRRAHLPRRTWRATAAGGGSSQRGSPVARSL